MLHKNAKIIPAIATIIMCLFMQSCASLFNSRYSTVTIETSEPANFIIDEDTLINKMPGPFTTVFENTTQPLSIGFFNEQHQTRISILPVRSKLYYLNLFSPYALGFLVDELNTKKWEYPRRVYVDLAGGFYTPYLPADSALLISRPNRIALTPLSPVGGQHPGLEISYQHMLSIKHSLQFTYKHFIPFNSELAKEARGFAATTEVKRFYRNTRNSRFYLSLGYEYLNKTSEASLSFTEPDGQGDIVVWQLTQIKKQFHSLTPRWGIEYSLGKRLILDGFAGFGARIRNVEHINPPENLEHFNAQWEWINYNFASNRQVKNQWALNLDLNLKIAWLF
ncbi:hypothetical protein [Roseivirga thermotolerans]|uniref:Uncharacterized protein n=1 Tax=Roseivirga thermotolerans TaxID=1758176 RepID=A0ABQ3I7T5_9BACT|nr:hypothetical protein [Roseivirga thermotolerans]GHE62955.1 hypothetical protein GCM10011340_17840 [Roseivirga thermotolerans]